MKTLNLFLLSIFAMVWLSACSEKDEPKVPETKESIETECVKIQLGDTLVEINTEFTETELLKALQDSLWYNNPVFPYITDGDKTKNIQWEDGYLNQPEPIHYKFEKDGSMNKYLWSTDKKYNIQPVKYEVSGKTLKITTVLTKETYELDVISVQKDRIILDMKYQKDFYTISKELNNWFNPETAKFRYVWTTGVKSYPAGTIIYPDGTIEYPDGTIIYPDGTVKYPEQ